MNIYIIKGGFLNGELKINIEKYPVLHKDNYEIVYKCGCLNFCEPIEYLDMFFTGALETDNPRMSISTIDEEKIEHYKAEIIRRIRESLERRARIISSQLEILNSQMTL